LLSKRIFRASTTALSGAAFLSKTDIYVGVDIAADDVPADYRICSLLYVAAIEPMNAAATESN
jgi:hypothetical protein